MFDSLLLVSAQTFSWFGCQSKDRILDHTWSPSLHCSKHPTPPISMKHLHKFQNCARAKIIESPSMHKTIVKQRAVNSFTERSSWRQRPLSCSESSHQRSESTSYKRSDRLLPVDSSDTKLIIRTKL
jgi:hypothetical protein